MSRGARECWLSGGSEIVPTDGVRVVRVSSVNDDVSLLEEWNDKIHEVIDWLTSLDKEHHTARLLQAIAEFLERERERERENSVKLRVWWGILSVRVSSCRSDLDGMGADDLGTLGLVLDERVNFRDSAIEHGDLKYRSKI